MGSRNQNNYNSRSHKYQIEREIFKNCPMRNNFLPNRSATTWNNLPTYVAEAKSVNSFKAGFDRLVEN